MNSYPTHQFAFSRLDAPEISIIFGMPKASSWPHLADYLFGTQLAAKCCIEAGRSKWCKMTGTDPLPTDDIPVMMRFGNTFLAMIWSLGLIPQIAMTSDEQFEVSTPDGNFQAKKNTAEQVEQEISAVDPDLLEAIDLNASFGPAFVNEFLSADGDPTLKNYDEAFRLWQAASIKGDTDIEDRTVVDLFGSVLGKKLAEDLNMEWVTVTDEYGTDYAVIHRDLQVFAYPFATVQKRVDRSEYGFMNNVYYMVKQSIETGGYLERDEKAKK